MPEIIQDFNWLDILFLILLLGMIYKGSMTGVGGQVISLIGLFVLMFFSIGYYYFLSTAIFGFMLQTWARPASFFIISAVLFVIIKVLERVFNVISTEESSSIERIGGAIVASLRACLIFGLIGMQLLLVPVDYLRLAVMEGSKTCMFFVNLDAEIFSWMTGHFGIMEKRKKDDIVKSFLEPPKKSYK